MTHAVNRMARIFLTILATMTAISTVHAATSTVGVTPLPTSILQNNIAYFTIGTFTPDVASRMRATIQYIMTFKPRGLVLDLRDNQGGDVDAVHGLLEALLPKGTPYMRTYIGNVRRIQVTAQQPILKRSTPVVVLRNPKTVNEPDIVIYALQKLRGAGVIEYSPTAGALTRIYKQHARMQQFRPIKEAIFYVTPDVRIIGAQGGSETDLIPRAVSLVREMSPWDEQKKSWSR